MNKFETLKSVQFFRILKKLDRFSDGQSDLFAGTKLLAHNFTLIGRKLGILIPCDLFVQPSIAYVHTMRTISQTIIQNMWFHLFQHQVSFDFCRCLYVICCQSSTVKILLLRLKNQFLIKYGTWYTKLDYFKWYPFNVVIWYATKLS